MSRKHRPKRKQQPRATLGAVTKRPAMNPEGDAIDSCAKLKEPQRQEMPPLDSPWSRNDKIQSAIAVFALLAFGANGLLWHSQQSNFKFERRSWVGAVEGKLGEPIAVGEIPYFVVTLKNTG